MSERNDSFGGEPPQYVYVPVPVSSKDWQGNDGADGIAGAAGCLIALPLVPIWFVCAGLYNFILGLNFPIMAIVLMLSGLIWLVWKFPKSSTAIGLPTVVLLIYWMATLPQAFLAECLPLHGVLDLTPLYSREMSELTSLKGLSAGVKKIHCSYCEGLTSLEGLPDGVEEVESRKNMLCVSRGCLKELVLPNYSCANCESTGKR